jgi:hypothetical protein
LPFLFNDRGRIEKALISPEHHCLGPRLHHIPEWASRYAGSCDLKLTLIGIQHPCSDCKGLRVVVVRVVSVVSVVGLYS